MASVLASTWGADTPQADGRRYVTEVFVLSGGAVRVSTYLADPDTDHDAHLAEMVGSLNKALVTLEPDAAVAMVAEAGAELADRG